MQNNTFSPIPIDFKVIIQKVVEEVNYDEVKVVGRLETHKQIKRFAIFFQITGDNQLHFSSLSTPELSDEASSIGPLTAEEEYIVARVSASIIYGNKNEYAERLNGSRSWEEDDDDDSHDWNDEPYFADEIDDPEDNHEEYHDDRYYESGSF